jgi:putative tryptophan/tyrosine transport system substrate-binding protein
MIRRRLLLSLLAVMLAAPLAAAEQGSKVYRIAFLALVPGEDTGLMTALLERLRELGYSGGKNMILTYRSAEGRPERLPQLAMDLVRENPDVLIAGFGTLAAQAAKAATTTIPIVFTNLGDPVGAGLVSSLGRPGGNVTGLTDQARDLQGKRLQILQEVVRSGAAQMIAVLMNPDTPFTALALKEVKAAADAAHARLKVLEARTSDQLSGRFEEGMNAGVVGLLVLEDPLTYNARRQLAELSARFRLPTIYGYRDFAEAGGLMSYGADRRVMYRRAAEYVDKILRGAKPADLAVEQPTTFEFVINLKTAKALGLTIPPSLLARADQVIE